MKAFVLTIKDLDESEQAADRCIKSASKLDCVVEKFYGYSPQDDPLNMLKELNIPLDGFKEKFSYIEKCVAAFLGHRSLWKQAVALQKNVLVLEHDAEFVSHLPSNIINSTTHDIISFGHPSYGKWNTPSILGAGKLVSKPYFPGAHAYMVTPYGASQALKKADKEAGPTDTFFNINRFPNLKEFYPWPIVANDSFTTIQRQEGCLAKHNWKDGVGYAII